jgi:hypothetical protein
MLCCPFSAADHAGVGCVVRHELGAGALEIFRTVLQRRRVSRSGGDRGALDQQRTTLPLPGTLRWARPVGAQFAGERGRLDRSQLHGDAGKRTKPTAAARVALPAAQAEWQRPAQDRAAGQAPRRSGGTSNSSDSGASYHLRPRACATEPDENRRRLARIFNGRVPASLGAKHLQNTNTATFRQVSCVPTAPPPLQLSKRLHRHMRLSSVNAGLRLAIVTPGEPLAGDDLPVGSGSVLRKKRLCVTYQLVTKIMLCCDPAGNETVGNPLPGVNVLNARPAPDRILARGVSWVWSSQV